MHPPFKNRAMRIRSFLIVTSFSISLLLNGCGEKEPAEEPAPAPETVQNSAPNIPEDVQDSLSELQGKLGNLTRGNEVPAAPANDVALYGENTIDTSVILDDYHVAVWINAEKLLKSQVVESFFKVAGADAPPGLHPLEALEKDIGIDPELVSSALILATIPETPNNSIESRQDELPLDPPVLEEPGNEEIFEVIEGNLAIPLVEQNNEIKTITPEQPQIVEPKTIPARPNMQYGAVIKFRKAANLSNLIENITTARHFDYVDDQLVPNHQAGTEVEFNGNKYMQGADGQPSAFLKDDTTLIVGSEAELKAMMEGKGGSNKLAEMIAKIGSDNTFVFAATTDEVKDTYSQLNLSELGLPLPQIGQLLEIAQKVNTSLVALNPDSDTPVFLQLAAEDAQASKGIFMQLNALTTLAKVMLPAQVQQFESNPNTDPITLRALQFGSELAQNLNVTNEADTITISMTWNAALRTQLLELVTVAAGKTRSAAMSAQSKNNMKQIGVAIYNYHFTYENLPVGEKDGIKFSEGSPLLSWRVHILPFIEQQELYDRFKLDEPWDSEHNIKLLNEMPFVYANPAQKGLQNKTVYRVPAGDNSILGGNSVIGLKDILDGTANSAMVLDVGPEMAIEWTKPDSLPIDAANVVSSFGDLNKVITVLLSDGSVLDIPLSMENDKWKLFLDYKDGEALELPRRR